MLCLEGTLELEVLVTLDFELIDAAKCSDAFDAVVLHLEEFDEGSVFDVDALLDLSRNQISLSGVSRGATFQDAESVARFALGQIFKTSLKPPLDGKLVSISAEARPEKLVSSL
jgi:hypothetical protein